jgi:predicted DNA-binding transcriptional regulator YafY
MSINKNALIRYHALDKCFSNPVKKCYSEILLEACNEVLLAADPKSNGIQLRQLYADIRFMESEAGYSIELNRLRDGKRTYYRYADSGFSIKRQPMNRAELEGIKSALQVLTRFKGMPHFEWIYELAPKMEQTFLLEKGSESIISFDTNQYLKGIEHLGALFNAILRKHVLCIQYQSFKRDEPKEYVLHPYYLKQYNNRWFLLGLYADLNKLTIFALDRIVAFTETDAVFIPNTSWDFEEYFDDVIGVTLLENVEPELVKLAFTTQSAPYILSKPLHGSQKTVLLDEKGLIITIEVIPNYELQTLILSHGDRVKVLEPLTLQTAIRERLMNAAALYLVN